MGSLSRLSRDTRDHSSSDYRIYVPCYSKNAATATAATFIDCYTPYANTWNRATSIPGIADKFVLKHFAMVPSSHYIYVIGGLLSPQVDSGEHHERAVPCVRRYNVRSDTWDACTPMSTPRFNFACTVSNHKIYVAGGQTTSGRAEGISSTEVYDPSLDQWTSLPNMNITRYNCVGITWKGKIYAVGGFVGGRPYVDVVARSSAEVYDEKQNSWVFVNRMWDLDIPPNQIVAMNEMLFSSGDRLKPWKGHIELYDENDKIWNAVHASRFNFTPGRLYLTMAPIGNHLYFLAGYKMPGEESRLRSEVHVFDTAALGDGWRSFEPVEEDGVKELCGHCCVLKLES